MAMLNIDQHVIAIINSIDLRYTVTNESDCSIVQLCPVSHGPPRYMGVQANKSTVPTINIIANKACCLVTTFPQQLTDIFSYTGAPSLSLHNREYTPI
jgi:hypothetical protein